MFLLQAYGSDGFAAKNMPDDEALANLVEISRTQIQLGLHSFCMNRLKDNKDSTKQNI